MKTLSLAIVVLFAVSSVPAFAATTCGQIKSIETNYTPEQTIQPDYSNMDQGYGPQPYVVPAVERVKITIANGLNLTLAPKDVKVGLALSAMSANLSFCFDTAKNTASITR